MRPPSLAPVEGAPPVAGAPVEPADADVDVVAGGRACGCAGGAPLPLAGACGAAVREGGACAALAGGASLFGLAAGCAGFAALASPAASMTPTTVWMGTVFPSATLISFSTPAEGDGISASTLSVEISNKGSSRSTLSPGFLSHLVIVPSNMLSPICGITMSTAMSISSEKPVARWARDAAPINSFIVALVPRQLFRDVENFLGVRQKIFFQRRRIGNGSIERGHPQQRSVQVTESFFTKYGGNFAGDSARFGVLMNDQAAVGFLHRFQDGLFIQRQKGAQVNHFCFDAFFSQSVRSFQRSMHHGRVGNNGQVLSRAPHDGFTDGHGVIAGWQLFLDAAIQIFVLKKQHRIIVAYSRFQKALGVVGCRRIDNLQPRCMYKIHFRIRGMEWPAVDSAARWTANHDGRRGVPEIMPLGHEIRQLVEAASDEIYKLHLGDGPQPEITHTASSADDGALTDGRVDDPLPAKTLEQPLAGFERAAIHAHIFA